MLKPSRVRMPPTQNEARRGGSGGAIRGSLAGVTNGSRSGRRSGGPRGGGRIVGRGGFAGRTLRSRSGPAASAVESAAHVGRPAQDVLPLDGGGVGEPVALLGPTSRTVD